MTLISKRALMHLLMRTRAKVDLRIELPDTMGDLCLSFIEGSQHVAAWREQDEEFGFVDLIDLRGARSFMEMLPVSLEELWRVHYADRQVREREFVEVLQRVSRFLEQPFPVPEWAEDPRAGRRSSNVKRGERFAVFRPRCAGNVCDIIDPCWSTRGRREVETRGP